MSLSPSTGQGRGRGGRRGKGYTLQSLGHSPTLGVNVASGETHWSGKQRVPPALSSSLGTHQKDRAPSSCPHGGCQQGDLPEPSQGPRRGARKGREGVSSHHASGKDVSPPGPFCMPRWGGWQILCGRRRKRGDVKRGPRQHGIPSTSRVSALTSQSRFLFFFSKDPQDLLFIVIQLGPAERFSATRRG